MDVTVSNTGSRPVESAQFHHYPGRIFDPGAGLLCSIPRYSRSVCSTPGSNVPYSISQYSIHHARSPGTQRSMLDFTHRFNHGFTRHVNADRDQGCMPYSLLCCSVRMGWGWGSSSDDLSTILVLDCGLTSLDITFYAQQMHQ